MTNAVPRADFAITVEFLLHPGGRDEFLRLVRINAAQSVEREVGCYRFDVLEPKDREDAIFLYEIYTDRAAFDVHLASEHFKSFDTATRSLVAGRTISVFALSEYAKP